MVFVGSNCIEMGETETLNRVTEEENNSDHRENARSIEDVEEGEISDVASVEEISEDDFKKQEVKKIVNESNSVSKPTKSESRVWTVKDLYKYQMGGGYVSGLHNLAWAQAVQNKPLIQLFTEVDSESNSKQSESDANSCCNGRELEMKVVDDNGEKEEGEIEEGEIDLDTEPVSKLGSEDQLKLNELEKKLNAIRGMLEGVTAKEVEKSFEAVCFKVLDAICGLKEIVREYSMPNLNNDAVNQLLYNAIRLIISVFGCMSNDLKEQKKEVFSRFISVVNNNDSHLFSLEQAKGIEVMISSVDSPDALLSARLNNTKDMQVSEVLKNKGGDLIINTAGSDLNALNKSSAASAAFDFNKSYISSETPKAAVSSSKSRGALLRPLIDLHKDHDEDSLPSPTRDSTPTLPVQRVLMAGEGTKPVLPTPKPVLNTQDLRTDLYETDALKAVSSYQQKFGRNSFFMSDRLPSPTPSEESGDGEGDTGGEVSSSSTINNVSTVVPPVVVQPVAPPPLVPEKPSVPVITPVNALPVSSGTRSAVKSSAKSRDPRLRYVNSDANILDQSQHSLPVVNNVPFGQITNSRKHNNVEVATADGPSTKKQRNSLENVGVFRDGTAVTRSGLLLEDTNMSRTHVKNKIQANKESDTGNIQTGVTFPSSGGLSVNRTEQMPVQGTNATTRVEQAASTNIGTTPFPELLKDIAENPLLINILKMRQQRLALDAKQKTADPAKTNGQVPTLNSIVGSVPLTNVVTSHSQGILPKPGILHVPSQMSASDELGKMRMKPRDPRRALHNSAIQRTSSLGPDQPKTNVSPTSTDQGTNKNQIVQKQEGDTEMKQTSLKSSTEPDISMRFTNSLKNVADMVSAPPVSTTLSLIPNLASQPPQNKSERVDSISVSLNSDRESGNGSAVDVAIAASSLNAWEDVEHLFHKYDDQQKAAIQRERARRIEEQKKMFAARKLCLVLDLDHTLLNSAKFVEVDPVHDEILKKKEEQDREKPFRHLFRFPHMGMWTKLRPGIWNFLEKASQLYELHLYTMGNKLYATEMAKLLDPKGNLFAGRVISRGDDGDPFDSDERVPKSKDLEGVLGMESAVVIIDDSVRVWPHNKLNLIVVERYIYFPCSRRQFGLPGPSLLEIDHDERPEDGTLACSLSVIERLHQNFFAHQSLDEADVRSILATEQRKILDGCRILFSRVFPVGEVNPHLHPLWQTAEQFGAVCTNQIDDQVTHVVANSLGTDKVNWALSTGRHVVHPGWVEASALLYRRANEQDFAIK